MTDELKRAYEEAQKAGKRGLIITGPIESGKTSAILALSAALKEKGILVDGIASPRLLAHGKTVGYKVQDVRSGEEYPLCSLRPPGLPFRRFYFSPEGLAKANIILARAAKEAEVAVIDEVGPLELSGHGFAPGLSACLAAKAFLLLSVRPHLLSAFLVRSRENFAVFTLPKR